MPNDPGIIAFASRDAMASRIADLLEISIKSSLCEYSLAEIAVSGGSTPEGLYQNLAKRSLRWNSVALTLVDERWVSADHPRSNEAFVRRAFSDARGVRIVGLYNGAASPSDAIIDTVSRLDARPRPFDAVVLGMGDDGHTASWFPHAEGLGGALNSTAKAAPIKAERSEITGDEVDRITLTLAAIKDAGVVVLMIAGQSKRRAFERALEPGPVEEMPVRAILRARPDIWACWAP